MARHAHSHGQRRHDHLYRSVALTGAGELDDADLLASLLSGPLRRRRTRAERLLSETGGLWALARLGLQSRDIQDSEIDDYLDVIGARVDSGQNGAAWQRRWVAMNGPDLHALLQAYRQLQDTGQPVHTWSL